MRRSIPRLVVGSLGPLTRIQTPTIYCASRFHATSSTVSPRRHKHDSANPPLTRPRQEGIPSQAPQPSVGSQFLNLSVPPGEPDFAFAFDIDGVLLRSSQPIKGAEPALNHLTANNVPFILLTNGGGKHESARVEELSKRLGVRITEENFIQSHTPFKALVEGSGEHDALKDKVILVTGGNGDKCREVAEQYGFKNVVTPGDLLHAYPNIWPFNEIFTDFYKSSSNRPLPRQSNSANPSEALKFDAIFVFNDPRDWALDCQIILDLLLSKEGHLGTYSSKNGDDTLPNRGWQQDQQPKLFFSNPDLFWATDYHLSRLGQGGFQAALEGIWNATTKGAKLDKTVIGKPHTLTYMYAEKVLNKYKSQTMSTRGLSSGDLGKIRKVYMVGDNPESDIRGANNFKSPIGTEWASVLVKTGVYKDGTVPAYKPDVIVDDVFEGVKWALNQEGWKGNMLS